MSFPEALFGILFEKQAQPQKKENVLFSTAHNYHRHHHHIIIIIIIITC